MIFQDKRCCYAVGMLFWWLVISISIQHRNLLTQKTTQLVKQLCMLQQEGAF